MAAQTRHGNPAAAAADFADHALHGTEEGANVALGPIVWQTEEGSGARYWYFVVAAANTAANLRITQLKTGVDRELAAEARLGLSIELSRRRPIVIHDFDSELGMARFMAAAWPSDRTRNLSASVEAEEADPHG